MSSWRRAVLALGLLLFFVEPSRVTSIEAREAAAPRGVAAERARESGAPREACWEGVCDVTSPACVARVFGQMRCFLGDHRHLSVPPVTLIDASGMASVTSPRSDSRERRRRRRTALRLLTLDTDGEPGEARAGPTPLGFYSYQERRIYVLSTPQKDEGYAAYFGLVHEMVHAIQDGDGDLSARSREPRSFDAELGEEALLEGEARYYTQLVRAHLSGRWTDDLRTGFAAEPGDADRAALRDLSILRSSAQRFTLTYGAYFAAHDDDFRKRFSKGDATSGEAAGTSLLLQKRHEWPRLRYGTAAACTRRKSGDDALVHEDRVGPWAIQTLFNRAMQSTTIGVEVARQVRGDWVGLYGTALSDSFVVWRLEMSDAEAAKQAARLLRTARDAAPDALRIVVMGNVLTLLGGADGAHAEAVLATCK